MTDLKQAKKVEYLWRHGLISLCTYLEYREKLREQIPEEKIIKGG